MNLFSAQTLSTAAATVALMGTLPQVKAGIEVAPADGVGPIAIQGIAQNGALTSTTLRFMPGQADQPRWVVLYSQLGNPSSGVFLPIQPGQVTHTVSVPNTSNLFATITDKAPASDAVATPPNQSGAVNITKTDTGVVSLTFGSGLGGRSIESTTDLNDSPVWSTFATIPTGETFTVVIAAGDPQRYFRLK